MSKRYIDFAPVRKKGGVSGVAKSATKASANANVAKNGAPMVGKKVPMVRNEALTVRKGAPRRVVAKKPPVKKLGPEEVPLEEIFGEKLQPVGVSKGLKEPAYGVIEDYQPKFVSAEVKKRPLGAARSISAVGAQPRSKVAHAGAGVATGAKVGASMAKKETTASASLAPMRTRFLNTNKIEKRPLSARTAYANKVATVSKEAVKEEKKEQKKSKGPERIIAKPDKDSKAGLIIAVILTIILGAAAGTVAFLLLPK